MKSFEIDILDPKTSNLESVKNFCFSIENVSKQRSSIKYNSLGKDVPKLYERCIPIGGSKGGEKYNLLT